MSEFAWIFQDTASAIKALIERFIEKPYFFYTEQDMHAFLYHKLISGKLGEYFVGTSSKDQTILVHKEYPTLKKYVGLARLAELHLALYLLIRRLATAPENFASVDQVAEWVRKKTIGYG